MGLFASFPLDAGPHERNRGTEQHDHKDQHVFHNSSVKSSSSLHLQDELFKGAGEVDDAAADIVGRGYKL